MVIVLLCFLDGFSNKYLGCKTTPHLYSLLRSGELGYRCIHNLFAFEGIGTTIHTGTWPETHGIWTSYVLKNPTSIQHNPPAWSTIFKLTKFLPSDRLQWDFRLIWHILREGRIPMPNLIPPNMMHLFQYKAWNSTVLPTLFETVRKAGIHIEDFSHYSDAGLKKAAKYLRDIRSPSLVYCKFDSLDSLGHNYGPTSFKVQERLLLFDKLVATLLNSISDRVFLIFFSDTGMVPVKGYVDILSMLTKLPLKICKDYILFVDSTIVRFWFKNQNTKQRIQIFLSEIKQGKVLESSTLRSLHVPYSIEYGDLVFALDEGYVFYPDFFRSHQKVRGMHSYYAVTYDNPVLLFYPSDILRKGASLVRHIDIMPTVLSLLGIDIPDTVEGISLT
jgi:predicted AlkP superfamily pyrophosphatase or phosphodiesterase